MYRPNTEEERKKKFFLLLLQVLSALKNIKSIPNDAEFILALNFLKIFNADKTRTRSALGRTHLPPTTVFSIWP